MALGWLFLYEGVSKVYSMPEGRDSFLARVLSPHPPDLKKAEPPLSAQGYLRASARPLAPHFRSLVPDVDGLDRLDPAKVRASWGQDLERHAAHYHYDARQREEANRALNDRLAVADAWFRDLENAEKIRKYKDDLAHLDRVLSDPHS